MHTALNYYNVYKTTKECLEFVSMHIFKLVFDEVLQGKIELCEDDINDFCEMDEYQNLIIQEKFKYDSKVAKQFMKDYLMGPYNMPKLLYDFQDSYLSN